MIKINFEINNPWGTELYSRSFTKSGKVSKNKSWEIEVSEQIATLFKFHLSFSIRRIDHPGLRLSFNIVGIEFNFQYYDNRHWDYENDCFQGNKT
jgi:hypothetical protein